MLVQRVSNSPSILISLNEHLASHHCDENCVANIFSNHIHSKHCETPSYRSVSLCFHAGELLRNSAVLPRAQTKCAETTKSYVLFLFIYYVFSWVFFFKQKHESIVHLACQFMHLLCIFRTRRGADFFRQFVSGSGSFQVQQKVSWELLEKRESENEKRMGRAFTSLIYSDMWTWWMRCAAALEIDGKSFNSIYTSFSSAVSLGNSCHLVLTHQTTLIQTIQGFFLINFQTVSDNARSLMLCIIETLLMLLYTQPLKWLVIQKKNSVNFCTPSCSFKYGWHFLFRRTQKGNFE